MELLCLGIDVSKSKFDVALLPEGGSPHHRVLPNSGSGFEQLSTRLCKRRPNRVHACMEATGTYGQALALYLHNAALIRDHVDQNPPLKQQRDLLSSIPGIGELTAAKLPGEIIDVNHYDGARQVAAFAGLCPGTTRAAAQRGAGRG